MIELTKWLRAELVTRAEHDHPWEACGLISRPRKAGPVHDRLLHLWAAENAAEDPETSFLIAPQDQFDILAQIERMGHDLVGLYHSHPRSGPEPSERDREIAQLWAGLTWVIVGRRPCSCLPVPIVGTAADNDLIPDEDCEEDCEGRGHHVEFWVGELASG